MMRGRASVAVLVLAAAVAPVRLHPQATPGAAPRVLRVTSTADDSSPGTLRWAIEASNATPELERIELEPEGRGPHVITLRAALAPIRGPVQIEGTAWKRTGEFVVIDGSGYIPSRGPESCPGAAPGQFGANVRTMSLPGLHVIDTADVEIFGVEIRRFCIGILIHRSLRVLIHDNRISENRGGAGVMLTGDDGQGNPTSTTTNLSKVLRNEFVDNGDGLELTRGAAFNLVADNMFRSTAANPEPGQGIEILRGNDNVVSANHFEGYSDGLQINWGDRNYIASNTFVSNTFGLSLTGVGNIVDGNILTGNRIGIVVRPADPSPIVRLTRNRLGGNGVDIVRCEAGGTCAPAAARGAIVFNLPGLEHASFVGSRGRGATPNPATLQHICPERAPHCQPAPNGGLKPPTLTSARSIGSELTISGSIAAAAASRQVVELFGNTDGNSSEAELFLDDRTVYTDANGHATVAMTIDLTRTARGVQWVTATVTSAEGATSPLSAPLKVTGTSGDKWR